MKQKQKVILYLYDRGSLSQKEAYELGIGRLASRVSELRKRGWNLPKEMVKNEHNNGRYAVYHLSALDMERVETEGIKV